MIQIEELEEIVRQARVGSIVPVHKVIQTEASPVDYFAKISDYGRKKNSMLLESAEIVPRYGEQSVGTVDPCLKLVGRGSSFEISALNELGVKFLRFIRGDLDFCDEIQYSEERIIGELIPQRGVVSEAERLKLKTHMDILRTIAFKFSPTLKPVTHYGGLFGILSYDLIDQFEDLPPNNVDILEDPDYEVYFADNVFMFDHQKKALYLIANALIMEEGNEAIYEECLEKIARYESALGKQIPQRKSFEPKEGSISTDTSEEEFCQIVEGLKEHISRGDVVQVVPSRTITADYNAEPLDIYRELRALNPSPYMFYFNNENGVLLGASPERCIGVKSSDGRKIVEIRPIAGTKPRGLVNDVVDRDLDSRYETELKLDAKELAEHTMLIDLARNDIARISEPGTRHVDEPYVVEKYSHVQHLVSNVSGILREDLDALHAYLASMNMGTLTGAPKVEAMNLIRRYERTKRGFYGGAVFYLTPNNDFDSAIVIRSMRLKGGKAHIRVGAGIVYDSIPQSEFLETERKAEACLRALKNVGGVEYD